MSEGTPAGPHGAVRQALAAIAQGRAVVVTDDRDREDEADLILAADAATPEQLALMIRHGSGIICAALPEARLAELRLPQMVQENTDPNGTAFTVSVDGRMSTTTGVSAADRARTIAALVAPDSAPGDFRRPGHVFPLRARMGGVLERPGHTEAALDLALLAGRAAGGVLCELTNDDGTMMRGPAVREFVAEHDLPRVSIAELIAYRRSVAPPVEKVAAARLPTRFGDFTAHAFRAVGDGTEYLALTTGPIEGPEPVLARVHSVCLTGDTLGSLRCDCGDQLDLAMRMIGRAGRGVLVYLDGHEGRGIGLGEKIRAYALQDDGADTVQANLRLGLPVDSRNYGIGAQILLRLGVDRLRLLTNNPDKSSDLEGYGLEIVDRVPLVTRPRPQNIAYLRTKQERMGHLLPLEEEVGPTAGWETVGVADEEVCWP
ncbi:MAG: bifunctional 3,4-dihydroxy-2-butanone-4-phosphate synthase/GTP cyclohydrolase II [Actinobacteria bacterium]|nr:bifunctional 3,4-dihydroxy-2-butanone-4-phosphate synthase/GTP cyclohydrolase II [Actinomycetota bacterium]